MAARAVRVPCDRTAVALQARGGKSKAPAALGGGLFPALRVRVRVPCNGCGAGARTHSHRMGKHMEEVGMRRKRTGKSYEQLRREASERMKGERNPMRRPEVAAVVGQALKERMASDPVMRELVEANLEKGRIWTPERRASAAQRAASIWTPEMREVARQRSAAYQERVRIALAASPVKV